MTKKKRELILVLFILVVAAAGFFINHTLHQAAGRTAADYGRRKRHTNVD